MPLMTKPNSWLFSRDKLAAVKWREWTLLGIVFVAAFALRLGIVFKEYLIPGANSGYYPVQVRSLLTTQSFVRPELPLLFFIESAAAWLLYVLGAGTLSDSVLLGVKIVTSLVPALSAIPVYLLVKGWYAGEKEWYRAYAVPLFCAAIAVFCPYYVLISVDMQKNAAGIFFLFFYIYFLHKSIGTGSRGNVLLSLTFFLLTGLTHVLCVGVAVIYTLLSLVAVFVFARAKLRNVLKVAGSALLTFLAAVAAIYVLKPEFLGTLWKFSLLTEMFLDPVSIPSALQTITGPPFFSIPLMGYAIFALGPILFFSGRVVLGEAERVIVFSSLLAGLFLTLPITGSEYFLRFNFMGIVPLVLVLAFLMKPVRRHLLPLAAMAALLLFFIALGTSFYTFLEPTVSSEEYSEILEMQSVIPKTGTTIVLAPHGVEFWVTWALEVDAEPRPGAYWDRYDHVLFLDRVEEPGPVRGPWFPGFPLPPDAEILYEGRFYILGEVLSPPPHFLEPGPPR